MSEQDLKTFLLSKEEADIHVQISNQELRKSFAAKITWLFYITNVFVLIAISICFYFDVKLIESGKYTPADRLVQSEVIISIVGASTVQLGAIMIAFSRYLFK